MDIFDFGAIFGASEGNDLTFTAKLPWLECLVVLLGQSPQNYTVAFIGENF